MFFFFFQFIIIIIITIIVFFFASSLFFYFLFFLLPLLLFVPYHHHLLLLSFLLLFLCRYFFFFCFPFVRYYHHLPLSFLPVFPLRVPCIDQTMTVKTLHSALSSTILRQLQRLKLFVVRLSQLFFIFFRYFCLVFLLYHDYIFSTTFVNALLKSKFSF